MIKALIIGCGNIGAMYDFETQSVLTYAKAFYLDLEIEFDVYDVDNRLSQEIAKRYGVRALDQLSHGIYKNYDIVAICTPTSTHDAYLSCLLCQGPKLVICEKPVDVDRARLERTARLFQQSDTKVMVNFYRRFQPGIVQLKLDIQDVLAKEPCTNVVLTYQRGFHNNASHAIDLLEFLFDTTLDLSEARISHQLCDEFDADPTMSVSCVWNGANVQFVGLVQAEFSHFEVAIYFARKAVFLKDGGNEIEWFSSPKINGRFYPKLSLQKRQTDVLKDYMVHVVRYAKRMLKGEEHASNFLGSISISQQILKLQGK